jgi:hypothetical protein
VSRFSSVAVLAGSEMLATFHVEVSAITYVLPPTDGVERMRTLAPFTS